MRAEVDGIIAMLRYVQENALVLDAEAEVVEVPQKRGLFAPKGGYLEYACKVRFLERGSP